MKPKRSPTKMRILHVSPDWFPKVAGCAVASYNIAKHLTERGHGNTILTCERGDLDKKGMNVSTVPTILNIGGMQPIAYGLAPAIMRLQKSHDVIVIHSYMYEMNARIALMRKMGLIGKPVVLYFHGGLDPGMEPYLGLPLKIAKRVYDQVWGRICFKCSDHVITLSQPDGELIKKFFDLPGDKVTYINNGTEVKRFGRRKKDGKKRVIFVGRLVKWKGIDFFPRIMESIPSDVEFLIVGGGHLEPEILELSEKYQNIRYTGDVPYAEIPELLGSSDLLILPSHTEAAPNTIIEASATVIPSIAFAVGDIPNILPEGNGYSIKPFDIEDFCRKMELLLEDDALRESMGEKARKYAEQRLDYAIIAKKVAETLEAVTAQKHNSLK
jgi:glycosyltransferase involved in cell wall biosynthesis